MKLPQSRLPCRAHNHFSPAIVLWQYFVAPTRPLYPARRQSSTAPESAHNSSPPQDATTHAQDAVVNHAVESPISRKTSSSRKTSHRISAADTTPVAVDPQAWRGRATAAQRSSDDYEGVAVQPVRGTYFVRDGAQPWALEEQERALPFLDR
jgi:non-canonical poly(A) RNA polymerase PAPD5/7